MQNVLKNLAPSSVLTRYLETHPNEAELVNKCYGDKPQKVIEFFAEKSLKKDIKTFKYNVLSVLTAKYLAKKISTEEFMEFWSITAAHCVKQAHDEAVKDAPEGLEMVVIAVGKLGAGELNYSSDIDIIFLYNSPDNLKHHEAATKIAGNIVTKLSGIDENRFCFRVDTDLRPEGKAGPLANSVDGAVAYYEQFGSELDRLMLIRANPIAGSIKLGEEFLKRVRPFVYRKNWDLRSLTKIRDTKEKIELEALKSKEKGFNVKLGEGGIREVEFIIQAIQLLHGGRDEKIISRNTLAAFDAIKKAKYIPKKECDNLRDAYLFLRHLENMIQLPKEQQTHTLPASPDSLNELAHLLGLSPERLLSEIELKTSIVKHNFQYLFEKDYGKHEMEEAILYNISSCDNEEEEIDSLAWFKKEETKKIQFNDLEKHMPPVDVAKALSLVAEVVISEGYMIAKKQITNQYGRIFPDKMNDTSRGFAVIGMGKLGGGEIDYASDLDLMFVYSTGSAPHQEISLSAQEYFTKLSQRIISTISLPTRYGRAYQIDTDLRPSGRAGVLVTSFDAFKKYHVIEAHLWERQALLKARPLAGDPKFMEQLKKLLPELIFGQAAPINAKEMIHDLRLRMEKEKAQETATKINIKHGAGGILDIESIVQYLQLKYGPQHKDLQEQNTWKLLTALKEQRLLSEGEAEVLTDAYNFMRQLLSRIRLFLDHGTNSLKTDGDKLSQIAASLGFDSPDKLIEKLLKVRKQVRGSYSRFFGYSA